MRVPHYLVRRENGGFHFRKRIPPPLRALFGGSAAVKQSLRTHCMDTAKARASVLSLRYDSLFFSLGMKMANPSIDNFPHLLDDADGRKYKIRLPDGTEVDAKDAADHARAVEFLKTKTACDLDIEASRRATAEAVAKADAANLAAKRAEAAELAQAMQPIPASPPPPQPHPQVATFKRLTIAKALDLYEDATTRNEKDKKQNLKIVSDFSGHAKIKYVDEISRPQVNAWITHLKKLGNGDKTIKNKVEYRLKQFIEWAMGAGYYPKGDNPAVGHKSISKRQKESTVAKEDGGEEGFSPYTLAELADIMAPENMRRFRLSQDTIWSMLMAVYSGARVSEIGQLYLNDLWEDKDGTWVLRIDVVNPHQSVKTISSKRKIPIHPDLIELGLPDRIRALKAKKQNRLFPASNLLAQNGAGAVFGTRFGRYRAKLKLPDTAGRTLGFHSLRTTFIHEVGQTDFESDRRRRMVGHEVPGVDFQDYLKYFRPSVLLKDLLAYWKPPIDKVGIAVLLKDLGPLEQIERTQRQRKKAGADEQN